MPSTFSSTSFTIQQILVYTYKSPKFNSRFDYRDRDVLKTIKIQTVKKYNKDRLNMPEKKYVIISNSYPQYGEFQNEKEISLMQKSLYLSSRFLLLHNITLPLPLKELLYPRVKAFSTFLLYEEIYFLVHKYKYSCLESIS